MAVPTHDVVPVGSMMEDLSPGTQTALLLGGRFGKTPETGPKPLEPREYNRLEHDLRERDLRPADLLQLDETDLADLPVAVDPARLQALLQRGGALALAVESWTAQGLWVVGRNDELYPIRLTEMGESGPAILYGAGDLNLLQDEQPALAIVGSRRIGEEEREYARDVARAGAAQGIQVVSGGARGVDSEAMGAAMERGGIAIGVLADGLARAARGANSGLLMEGQLVLLSPYDPAAGFNVGNAMGRNKYIYAMADAALVVHSAVESGGTWAGAVEALKREQPVFVPLLDPAPEWALKLLELGANAFPDAPWEDLSAWLAKVRQPGGEPPDFKQASLW